MVDSIGDQTSTGQGGNASKNKIFKELLDDSLDKTKSKLSSKKHKELIALCDKAKEEVDRESKSEAVPSANKYFYIFKMAIETKIPRLMEQLLYRIQKLFSYDLMDGDCEDNCRYPEGQSPPEMNGKQPRLLIDAIIETICKCSEDRDSLVQLEVIKSLLSITISVNSKVHERTLMEAFKTQYSIHLSTHSTCNRNAAKAALTQMVNAVFSKMDVYQRNGSTSLDIQRLYSGAQANKQTQARTSQASISSSSASTVNNQDGRQVVSNVSSESLDVSFPQVDQYVFNLVQNMVDNVCLHDARVKSLERRYADSHNMMNDSHATSSDAGGEDSKVSNEDEQQTLDKQRQELNKKVKSVMLNPVLQNPEDNLPQPSVKNEVGIQAGRYGWCMICRNSSDMFCSDTKHPVCSVDCQKKHIVECMALDNQQDGSNAPNFTKQKDAEIALQDAYLVFRSIVKLSVEGDKKPDSDKYSYYVIRAQIIGLELILAILEKPKQSFINNKFFVKIIENSLCDGLLRYSVSQEREVFSLVVSIFFCLFNHFRRHLKNVILVFLETIFLKLLDSGNSSYHHKHLILNVFDKISMNSMMWLEIFVNYDCDISQKDISKQIVEQLSQIAKGKFTKNEHKSLISAQEELVLRSYAMKILVQMLRSFNKTIDAEIAASKVSQRMQNSQALKNDSQNVTLTLGSDNDKTSDEGDRSGSISLSKANTLTSNKFQVLENQRAKKTKIGEAARKFGQKPKNGIKYLAQNKLIPDDENDHTGHVKGIVNFLKTTPGLDKTAIGEFLGASDNLNKDCLKEFIGQYDLKGKDFVVALRTILLGFRLPGEGQVVDRIMEIFGNKFIGDNPNGSDSCQGPMSAECVFLLSYATMMMQTTLHNPNAIKQRMTLEDFSKMVKGINSGQNLEQEFIQKIYDTVEREPFTLNEDEDARLKLQNQSATSYQMKQALFQKEGMVLVQRGQTQIQSKGNNTFIAVEDCRPIRPLFENIWQAYLVTFSLILEENNDANIAALCIEGFAHSIKICGFFNMVKERDACVSSFAKFGIVSKDRKLKNKNIMVIQKILELATYQGNYLGESWKFVLDCISNLEEMINMGTGNLKDSDFFDTNSSQQRKNYSSSQSANLKNQREQIVQHNSEIIVQNISMAQLDQIFQSSLNLDQDAIICFIENLCKVSADELKDLVEPRKFSLQALVLIADLNMARIRFVWTKIWQMLSQHFIKVGSHPSIMVALFAIDSLRQLADKFLIKEEFASFNFQKDFLKPFNEIMLNNLHTRSEIKEYIVMCITNICRTKTAYIKSGWSVIINIFTLAAQDNEEQLVKQSFQALKIAVTEQFSLLDENFVELINCLNKYSMNNMIQQQSIEAQELLYVCASKLQGNTELIQFFCRHHGLYFYQRDIESMSHYPPQYGIAARKSRIEPNFEELMKLEPDEDQMTLSVLKGLWFPVLTNLTNQCLDKSSDKKFTAIGILFKVLGLGVNQFNLSFWQEILSQVFFPMLEDIDLAIQNSNYRNDEVERDFFLNTVIEVVQGFNDFLVANIADLSAVIPSYADILVQFASQTSNRRINQKIFVCFNQLMSHVASRLSKDQCSELTQTFRYAFAESNPSDLMDQVQQLINLSQVNGETNKAVISQVESKLELNLSRLQVQLFLIKESSSVLASQFERFAENDTLQLLKCLQSSFDYSQKINSEFQSCMNLQIVDQMAGLQLFRSIVQQENNSLAALLSLKFKIYFIPNKSIGLQDGQNSLFRLCSTVLKDYASKETSLNQIKQEKLIIAQDAGNKNQDDQSSQRSSGKKSEADLTVLEMHEGILVKQIQGLTPIVQSQILTNFAKFTDTNLQAHSKTLAPILIDLTLCNDYGIRLQNKTLLTKLFGLIADTQSASAASV